MGTFYSSGFYSAFTQDEYPQENRDFFDEEGIAFMQIGMPGNKEETIRGEPDSDTFTVADVLLCQ